MAVDIIAGLEKIQKSAQANPHIQVPAGSFKVSVAILHHGKPANEYPIGQFLQRIYIFEDVEKMGITGWLEMIDPFNLVRNGMILGQELLYLEFCTGGADKAGIEEDWKVSFTKKNPLYIHKVQDLKHQQAGEGETQGTITYRLHFCSPELIQNDRTRVSRTLQGTYSDMIKNILKNDLKSPKKFEKDKNFIETEDLKHVIIPNINPFSAIAMMASSSQSTPTEKQFKGRLTDYYFWETSRGYRLFPIYRPHKDNIIFTVSGSPATASYVGDMTTAINQRYSFFGDTYSSIKAGAWGSKQMWYDCTNKIFDVYQSNYHTSLDKPLYAEVSQTPVFFPDGKVEKNVQNKDKTISDYPDGTLMFYTWNADRQTNINKQTGEVTYPWTRVPSTLDMQRQMQTSQTMSHQLMMMRVHGISRLEAGMTVQLELPDVGQGSGMTSSAKPTDAIWENRQNNIWLIKKLTHAIDLREDTMKYYCDMELSNTMRAQKKVLPAYIGIGSSKY